MSISFSAEGARNHTPALVRGMRDGVPIGLGYLAVAFSLGICLLYTSDAADEL